MPWLLEFDRHTVLSWNTTLHLYPAFGSLVKFVALYSIYFIPLVLIVWWVVSSHKQREILLSATLSGLVAFGIDLVWKVFVMRPRPDENLAVQEVLFRRPDTSFPSDHAAVLGGLAVLFWLKGQKLAGGWLAGLAIVVGLARIATAVHYPSDIIIGFLDGFLGAYIVSLMHDRLSDSLWARLIELARRLKLA